MVSIRRSPLEPTPHRARAPLFAHCRRTRELGQGRQHPRTLCAVKRFLSRIDLIERTLSNHAATLTRRVRVAHHFEEESERPSRDWWTPLMQTRGSKLTAGSQYRVWSRPGSQCVEHVAIAPGGIACSTSLDGFVSLFRYRFPWAAFDATGPPPDPRSMYARGQARRAPRSGPTR